MKKEKVIFGLFALQSEKLWQKNVSVIATSNMKKEIVDGADILILKNLRGEHK